MADACSRAAALVAGASFSIRLISLSDSGAQSSMPVTEPSAVMLKAVHDTCSKLERDPSNSKVTMRLAWLLACLSDLGLLCGHLHGLVQR